jgi:lysophospholipase L1-like esterase
MKKILSIIIVINLLVSCKKEDTKVIVCWGDSLTAPHFRDNLKGTIKKMIKGDDSYPSILENNLDNVYQVINCGVGGENTLSIMARQGAFPFKLAHDVVIFKSNKSKFTEFIGNSDIIAFESTYNNKKSTPLLRGWKETGSSHFNPCTINGKSFVIKSESQYWKEDKKYQFEYNYFIESNDVISKTYTLKKGSIIETNAMHTLRNAYANIFFMGQNGGFKDVAELIKQYKEMIKYSKSDIYIIIGYHKPNTPIPNIKRMIQMEDSLSNEFGNHYINLRSYLVKNGLKDANLNPTQIDTDSIIKNQVPPQLMTDGTHFTTIGYELIGNLCAKRFKELEY